MEVSGEGYVISGKLKLADPQKWAAMFERFGDASVVITVQTWKRARTAAQLRYYYGVLIPIVAEHEARKRGRELPYPKDETDAIIRKTFLPARQCDLGAYTPATHELSTEEFSAYFSAIQAHYAQEGLDIPEPMR